MIKTGFENEEITYTEIPCQVCDIVKWDDQKLLSIEEKDEKTGKKITRYLPTTTLSLAFLAKLKPHEKATYLVFYNNPSAPKPVYKSDITVTGKGLGKIIENNFYKTQLDEKSGAIFIFYEESTGIKVEHKLETKRKCFL